MMARATTPPTALHVIAKTGTEAGARITTTAGAELDETGLGPSVELLVPDVSSPAAVRATDRAATIFGPERARTARDVHPFRRGASTCITMAAFKFPAAAPGSAIGSECENEWGDVDPTIACGGAGEGGGW